MSIHTLSVQNQLTYCLAALSDNDFAGSVLHERHLTKLISERLLKTRNGLMIYNKIEWVLVITKQIFSYYYTDFSMEITSKVQKVGQKYTFALKLNTKCNFSCQLYFFSSTIMEWNAQDCGISKAWRIHLCCLLNSIRRRYLRKQEVKQYLDWDAPWCFPALECCLWSRIRKSISIPELDT